MRKPYLILIVLLMAGCVSVDPDTGETIPRGGQKYKFATVERRAEQLQSGMRKVDVLMQLGSPAEISDDGAVWSYLPERAAVLVPSRALHLTFENDILIKHGYGPIILGKQL